MKRFAIIAGLALAVSAQKLEMIEAEDFDINGQSLAVNDISNIVHDLIAKNVQSITCPSNCSKGSDSSCVSQYNSDYCCAHVSATTSLGDCTYYQCLSRSGIIASNGHISAGGISADVYCDNSFILKASLGAFAFISAMFF